MIYGKIVAKLIISKKLKNEKGTTTWKQSTQRRV